MQQRLRLERGGLFESHLHAQATIVFNVEVIEYQAAWLL